MLEEKLFSGIKPMELQLNKSINKFELLLKQIDLSEQSPEILLDNQIFENELELNFIFNSILINYGENALNTFQNDYIQKVLQVLKVNLPFDEITLHQIIDESGYYFIQVNISFMENTFNILNINPYLKIINVTEYEHLIELKNDLTILYDKLNEYNNQLNIIEQSYVNPSLFSGDNVKLYIKLNISKKKREEILNKEYSSVMTKHQQLLNEIKELEIEVEEIENKMLSINIIRDRYIDRLQVKYGFIKNEMIEENSIYDINKEDIELNFHSIDEIDESDNHDEDDINKMFFQNIIAENDKTIYNDIK